MSGGAAKWFRAVCEMIFISDECSGSGVFFHPLEFTHRWRRYE
jgi:hypothetical protein